MGRRLASLGLGQRKAVLVLYVAATGLGALAILVTRLSVRESYLLMAMVLLAGLAGVLALEQAPYQRQEEPVSSRTRGLAAWSSSD